MNRTTFHPSTPAMRQYLAGDCDRMFAKPVQTLRTWYRRSRSRYQLSRVSPQTLVDVGISEAQRQAEVAKPFWRA